MSHLYLDDEIDNSDLMIVAIELANSNLSIEEMDQIFYKEVHPVLCWNFTVPAGVWGSFSKDSLKKIITEHIEHQKAINWFKRWHNKYRLRKINQLREIVKVDWEKTKLLIELIRDKRINCK